MLGGLSLWHVDQLAIGLSLLGMLFAAFGFISPLYGAILQEAIDAIVIVNALRSTY